MSSSLFMRLNKATGSTKMQWPFILLRKIKFKVQFVIPITNEKEAKIHTLKLDWVLRGVLSLFRFCPNKLYGCAILCNYSLCLLKTNACGEHWTGQNNKGQRRFSKAFYCDGNIYGDVLYCYQFLYYTSTCTFFQPRVAIDELPRRKNERMLFWILYNTSNLGFNFVL